MVALEVTTTTAATAAVHVQFRVARFIGEVYAGPPEKYSARTREKSRESGRTAERISAGEVANGVINYTEYGDRERNRGIGRCICTERDVP